MLEVNTFSVCRGFAIESGESKATACTVAEDGAPETRSVCSPFGPTKTCQGKSRQFRATTAARTRCRDEREGAGFDSNQISVRLKRHPIAIRSQKALFFSTSNVK